MNVKTIHVFILFCAFVDFVLLCSYLGLFRGSHWTFENCILWTALINIAFVFWAFFIAKFVKE